VASGESLYLHRGVWRPDADSGAAFKLAFGGGGFSSARMKASASRVERRITRSCSMMRSASRRTDYQLTVVPTMAAASSRVSRTRAGTRAETRPLSMVVAGIGVLLF
jgi:hypothetical protein